MGSGSAKEGTIPNGRSGKTSWRREDLNWALKDEQSVPTGRGRGVFRAGISPSFQPLDWACLTPLGRAHFLVSRAEED